MSILTIEDIELNETQVTTCFSLVYMEATLKSAPSVELLVGPKLFAKKSDAERELMIFIKNRIFSSASILFIEHIEDETNVSTESLNSVGHDELSDALIELIDDNKDVLNFNFLIDWYCEYMEHDHELSFSYKIEEIPAQTFEDEIHRAIGFYANGSLTDDFKLTPRESVGSDDEIFLDINVSSGNGVGNSYYLSFIDAREAVFNTQERHWESHGNTYKIVTKA